MYYDLQSVPEDQRLLLNKTDESLAKAMKIFGFKMVVRLGVNTHALVLKDFEQKIQDTDDMFGKLQMDSYLSNFIDIIFSSKFNNR